MLRRVRGALASGLRVTGSLGLLGRAKAEGLISELGPLISKAMDAGIWVFAGGLKPGDLATTVDATGTQPILTDGPYLETKEWIGGFWVFELPDLDAALDWAVRASKACGGKVEVRPFQGIG